MAPGKSNRPGWRLVSAKARGARSRDHGADRDVDEQHPAPGQVGGEQAAGDQADRGAADAHRGVDAHRPVARGSFGEGGGDQGQRGRRDDRAADSLQCAGGQQPCLGGGEPASQRRYREQDDPGDEHAAPAQDVTGPAAQQQQAAEGQRVGVHDPFQARARKPERMLDMGKRDVHDRRVKHHHQLCGGDNDQGQAQMSLNRAAGSRTPSPGRARSIRLRSGHHILLSVLAQRSGEPDHQPPNLGPSRPPRDARVMSSCQDGRRH